jgi:hypothetical protein
VTFCKAHGDKYYLYAEAGPCLHPTCVRAMFSVWAASGKDKNIFSKYKESSDDVIGWVYSDGVAFLGSSPTARSSWAKALRAYEKHLAKKAIKAIVLPEVDLLMQHSSMAQAQAGSGTYTAYPDTRIWVYEVVQEVLQQASVGEAAYLLDVITLNDLAHLEYNGDQMMAREGVNVLIRHLQEWYFRGEGHEPTQRIA